MTDVGHTKQRYSGALFLSVGFLKTKRKDKQVFVVIFWMENSLCRYFIASLYQRCLALCGVNREFRMNISSFALDSVFFD